jgi:hypothetical protein
MRTVNQAIGRAIRHRDDFASAVLFDGRYEGFQSMLAKWIRPSVVTGESWTGIERLIKRFFAGHSVAGEVERKPNVAVDIGADCGKRRVGPVREAGTAAGQAVAALRAKVERDERQKLCEMLRRFKRDKDVEGLKRGLESLDSDESRSIVVGLMNDHLRARFAVSDL